MSDEIGWPFYFIFGVLVGVILSLATVHHSRINISDAELYRFCMQQNIELKDCKINRELLDEATHD